MSAATRLRLFYFLYYAGVGASLPYFAPYLRGLGFSGGEIGVVQMLGPLLAAPVALGWAAAADRMGSPARALSAATLWVLGAVAFLPWASTPLGVAAVLLAQGLADRAIVPLVDSVTMEWVRGRREISYTRIRLFGSLGYVAASLGLGLLLAARGDRPADPAMPLALLSCVAGYALLASGLPAPSRTEPPPRLRDLAGLLRNRPLAVLLAAGMIHWGCTAPFHLLLGVQVRDLGLPAWVTGVAMAVAVGAEIAALLAYPRLEGRLSTRTLFALAFGATAIRWALTGPARTAAALVAVQAFHAFTFGLFWGGSVRAMVRLVPGRLRATGQALFTAVVFGAGNAAGYPLAGRGYDRYGAVAPLYAWAAALELLPLLLVLLAFPASPPAAREEGPAALSA